MQLKELYQLEKSQRNQLMHAEEALERLIFDEEEFLLLEAIYENDATMPVVIDGVSFSESALNTIKAVYDAIDFEEKIPWPMDWGDSLSGVQIALAEEILYKMDDVEEVWEYEDEDRWEYSPYIQQLGVLFMMSEIDKNFGEEEEAEAGQLTKGEYDFLEAIYNSTVSEGTFDGVTFSEEDMDYIRVVLSASSLMHEVKFSLQQEKFLKDLLNKCRWLNEEEGAEEDTFNTFTIHELFEMDLSATSDTDKFFSPAQMELLAAVFGNGKKVTINEVDYPSEALDQLRALWTAELDWEKDVVPQGLSDKQLLLAEEIWDIYKGQFEVNLMDDEDEKMPLDIEVLFMMDELEREEMKALGELDGDLLFDHEQFALLKACFSVDKKPLELTEGLRSLKFTVEQLVYLEKLFKFEGVEEELEELLSEEQQRLVVRILQTVEELK
ncbi:hypothetical protein [Algivirga pacifica]|uniref:Uncharacterized protein n=1 Tax=Algivirga pacifica TaxID=1162670 RepID=A0ABP9DJB5_9BACT